MQPDVTETLTPIRARNQKGFGESYGESKQTWNILFHTDDLVRRYGALSPFDR